MSASSPPLTATPPLENGERLTRAEFMRRWEAMPELRFAERIEGVVRLMASPQSFVSHGYPDEVVAWLLMNYHLATPGTLPGANSTVHVDSDNDFQPDHALIILPAKGGQLRHVGRYVAGAPELVVEIAATSVKRDLGPKKNVYRRAGVKEYLVWESTKEIIHCFVNREGEFLPAELHDGVFKSEAFPGLWIDVAALVANDLDKVRETSSAGLADPSHEAFAETLK